MNHRPLLVLALIICLMCFASCATPAQPTLAPTVPPQIIEVVATPAWTPPLAMPNATVTAPAIPTVFITPPANGEAAVIPILMYHHLNDLPGEASELEQTWTVAPKEFDSQMAYLAQHGFHSITMAQLVAFLTRRQTLPSRPLVISFDDGWIEQYTVAYPILKKYGLRGTFFVYTNAIDHKAFMTWGQVEELAANGMDIESHSLTHPHLRTLSPDAAFKEIADSKTLIEKRVGKPVIAFNYPFGEYNSAIVDLVKRAGYASAVTIAGGYKQRADELFTLHRIRISYPDTLDDLAKRLPN